MRYVGKLSLFSALIPMLAAIASTGCGQTALDPGGAPAPGTGSGVDTPDPGFEIPSGLVPSDEFYFKVTGQGTARQVDNGNPMIVATDTQLLIAVEAGQGLPLGGFTVGFNCEWFRIKVGGISRIAWVKKSGYPTWGTYDPCAGARTTWADDFSAALTPGHGAITITVDRAGYDNCYGYDRPGFIGVNNGGCTPRAVYPTHSITGFLKTYTN